MKQIQHIGVLVIALIICLSHTACNEPEESVKNEYGMPIKIANNTILYKTSDNTVISFQRENIFGDAIIVSNKYSDEKGYGMIEFDSDVTEIGAYAFKGTELIAVVLPSSVDIIGGSVFERCTKLTTVNIPESVTKISGGTFYYCVKLSYITLHEKVEKIGAGAFTSCYELNTVYCKAKTPPDCGWYGDSQGIHYPFTNYGILFVPLGCKSVYENTVPWNYFEQIIETDFDQ